MHYSYKPRGVCSTRIDLEIEGDVIRSCAFTNGCRGNTAGVSRLVEGMSVQEVIERLSGIPCQGNTSCPDQLARALQAYLDSRAS